MKAYLSPSDYLAHIDSFLNTLDTTNPHELVISSHPKIINTHPAILTLLAVLSLQVGKENVRFDNLISPYGKNLTKMGFFDFISQPSPYTMKDAEATGLFIPLTIIKNASEQSHFISEIIPLLHLPPEKTDAIKYTVGELVRNAIEHSYSDTGAVVAAQYYKKSNTVRLGICDGGIGIKSSFAQFWPQKSQTDIDAIKWALVPGISGTTFREGGTEENAGAGLFFIKSIAQVARNYFMLYSGNGMFKLKLYDKRIKKPVLHPSPDDDYHAEHNDEPYFRGTLVGIDLTLDSDLDEFNQLLSDIRNVYSRAIRERKKRRYREPRFR